jgi:hypothetical protein
VSRRALALALLCLPGLVLADSPAETDDTSPSAVFNGREYLVPELAKDPLRLDAGARPFLSRISFSPGFGQLGSERLYVLRVAYNPNDRLGWEAAVGHNPGEAVHALLHTLSAIVRYPLPWRIQPYGSLGYGMILVYPGESLNSDPVTKNTLTAGGGVELYVRDDVALRLEARSVTALGGRGEGGGTVAYRYAETTVALAFYRGLDR